MTSTRNRPHILVRSLWQTVNIGDVAHAPGTLRAFQRFGAASDLSLWVQQIEPRERALVERFFPDVRIVQGKLDESGEPTSAELRDEFDSADLLLHGPGASLVAKTDVRAWSARTGRPYGFFGVTVDPVTHPDWGRLAALAPRLRALPDDHLDAESRRLLDEASFVFCRDTLSLEYLQKQGVKSPVLAFGPDATYTYDLHDHDAARRTMADHGLVEGEFVCAIPRLRYTPYHRIRGTEPTAENIRRDEQNARYQGEELRKFRELIVDIVRQRGLRVLLCPEMIYEVELAHDEVWEKLPPDVKESVAWLPYYWGLEEAAAVYATAHSVVSMECHSPIMAVAAEVPTLYVRQPTDTVKGQMWADLGLDDNIVELEDGNLVEAFSQICDDYRGAVSGIVSGRDRAEEHLRHMVATAIDAATGQAGPQHSRVQ